MKRLGIVFLLICLFFSCEEDTTYQMRILIKNETNSLLIVSVFPKSEYMSGHLYDFGIGNGYRHTEIQLEIDSEIELFTSEDFKKKPFIMATQVFDSIRIIPFNEIKTEMIFSADTVIGYSENLYSEESVWKYEVRNFDQQTSFKRNPIESHDYIFTISENKN